MIFTTLYYYGLWNDHVMLSTITISEHRNFIRRIQSCRWISGSSRNQTVWLSALIPDMNLIRYVWEKLWWGIRGHIRQQFQELPSSKNNIKMKHVLFTWFTQHREKSILVSRLILQQKAPMMSKEYPELDPLMASDGWLIRWK